MKPKEPFMKLCYWSEISTKHPSLTPSWYRGKDSIIFTNQKFGTILHVAVCNDTGQPLYDQPVWSEPVGAIIIPVDETGRIILVENFRNAPPAVGRCSTYPTSDLLGHGRVSLELPRGFPLLGESSEEVARREVEEETGYPVREVVFLGESNTNTTFFLNNTSVWLAYVAQGESTLYSPDPLEEIQKVRFLHMEEVMTCVSSGQIICALTKSALLHYIAWVSAQGSMIR
jgi:8-oxo-dGTP pyrophosphatase MutT (NUDIX family)